MRRIRSAAAAPAAPSTGRALTLVSDDAPAASHRSAAVIDLGSNSWRFAAYRYVPRGAWRRIGRLQETVRVAEGLAATGRVDAGRVEHGLRTLEAFATYLRALGIRSQDTTVVATSALRDAENGDQVLARARALTGLEIRTLTAEEEARYAYVAAVNSTTLTNGLALDLGGGSLQLVGVRDRSARSFSSWPLGAVRVTESLLAGDRPVSAKQLKRVRAALARELDGVHALTPGERRIVGMGGAARNLANAAGWARGPLATGLQGAVLSATDLTELVAQLARRPRGRRALPGIKAARADIILAAALVLEAVLELTEVDALEVTRAGLREGVFFASHLLAGTSPVVPDVRAAAVRGLCRQHSVDLRRAEHVAELALGLHDSVVRAAAISAGDEERELLWAAAMLHEVGMAIDFDGHPLHSRYVLLNSELYGFGPREVALLAQIVRHHRKGTPSLDDLESLAMPNDGELVARCALILRLAVQLAPGPRPVVRHAQLVPDGSGLRLELAGDARLARWILARQADDEAFRAAFGRPLLARCS